MNDEWPEGRIEFTTVNAGNLTRVHVDVVQAMQAVDRETCTAVVIPGASTGEAARILRMVVDREVNNAAAERERIVTAICSWSIKRQKETAGTSPMMTRAFDEAIRIASGEHMEEK